MLYCQYNINENEIIITIIIKKLRLCSEYSASSN